MNKMKRMIALIIVMVMILGTMNVTVMAASTGAAKSDDFVSVTDLTAGDKVTYYQVLEWVDNVGWAFKAPFDTALTDADLKEIIGDSTTNPPTAGKITQAMAKKIAAAATSGGQDGGTIAQGETTWTLTDPDPGLYMVVVTSKSPMVIYNPAFVGADYTAANSTNTISIEAKYSNTAVAKKTDDIVFKTTADSDSAIAQAIDSYVGQEVTFYVDTTIPVFLPTYKNPTFNVDDEIKTAGIEFVAGSVEVSLDGTKVTDSYNATEFTLTDNGVKGYSIVFDQTYLAGNTAPVALHIEYKGTITNTAEFNVNEDNNEVKVTYSNGPDEANGALIDRTNHYTFSIGAKAFGDEYNEGKIYEYVKVGVDESGNPVVSKSLVSTWIENTERHPLKGATFGLYTDPGCDESSRYKYGKYADTAVYPDGAEFTTEADGIITFTGLAAGTYYIKELSAPSGYIKDGRISSVTIDAHYKKVDIPATVDANGVLISSYQVEVLDYYTVTIKNVSEYDSTTETYAPTSNAIINTFTFDNNDGPCISSIEVSKFKDSDMVNTQGVELPSTGGMGTTLFYVIGAILVIGAGVILVTRRRMAAN